MIEALRFVRGAIAKKDFVPELTHYKISHGMVRGYNGEMALCSPIPLEFDITPKALDFIRAIESCTEAAKLHVTKNGRLAIESGNFKAYVECLDGKTYPEVYPTGEQLKVDFDLVSVLKTLYPFIAEDASRPWARGILLAKQSAYATNNIILLEHWLPSAVPVPINIPKSAVQEIIRIGENPTSLQLDDKSVSFHYEGGRWLRSQLYELGWPNPNNILALPTDCEPVEVPIEFWENLERLVPFVGDLKAVMFDGKYMRTTLEDNDGAMLEVPGCPETGAYNAKILQLLAPVVTHVDWTVYPRPVPFFGHNIRGAIAGIRTK